ncbi:MAG TPA: signal transduction protein [Thiobacillaceae bacterium]|nr:signal transduction protein [Thiobacillaceae bacterium]
MKPDSSSSLVQPSGGGVDTEALAHAATITQVGGADTSPVREEELRERFLTFDPIFDRAGQVVARELILRGRFDRASRSADLAQMDEDMLLTGLYSLAADKLTGDDPLLVRISHGVLMSEVPENLNQPNFIWAIDPPHEEGQHRVQNLKQEGLMFCLDETSLPVESIDDWDYIRVPADISPSSLPIGPTCIVTGIRDNAELRAWPYSTWIQGLQHLGASNDAGAGNERLQRMDLLTIALRQPLNSLLAFFKLNPDLQPQLLRVATSAAGGLSREPESAAHALVLLGPQRAQRVAVLLAIAGLPSTADSRLCARTALSRALFMGRLARIHGNPTHAALAFDTGLYSTFHVAFSMSIRSLSLKLGLAPEIRDALAGKDSQQSQLLRLAHACETNDGEKIARLALNLGLTLDEVSANHLDALLVAEELDQHLI